MQSLHLLLLIPSSMLVESGGCAQCGEELRSVAVCGVRLLASAQLVTNPVTGHTRQYRHITTLHWVWCISVAVVMGYYGEVCDILIWSIVTMVTQWLVYV